MTCGACGSATQPGQKFCPSCGTALVRGCPSCGTASQPGQRFCAECGTNLDPDSTGSRGTGPATATLAPDGPAMAPPRSDAVAERRLVSILFADLVGFTTFAEDRDAEDVRETLSRYFDLASDVIGRHGGTVEKFIGDAVMAVWGAPTAREDDAERAVRAGLELVDAVRILGPSIQARAGVLTGEAAVTLRATNQGMVAGDLVNTASRLQSVAPVGTVLVGEATFRAASRSIVFESAGEQVLKGKVAPVPAWRAIRVVAERGGRGRTESLEAPFVGRDHDLRLVKDLFHATERDRRLRLVSIVGTGGIGKSRLAWEFEKYLDGIVGDVWWHHGRSPAYGEGITFWALGEMIRARARLAETDDEASTRAGVAAMLDQHMPDDADRRWVERALLELLGVRSDVPSNELFGAWRRFFERLAEREPVILVFQDLHWADTGTLDFIDHLLEWSRAAGIFIVTLARPELLERRPEWGAGQRSFTSIHLDPLPAAAMGELLDGLVPAIPSQARAAIIERAEGVPLYAVETVRMLAASGQLTADEEGVLRPTGDLADLSVPETLTALIAARLDALDPDDRALLLDAAVLGQSFTPAGLAAVSGVDVAALEPRLRSLARREVLAHVADPRSPERGQYGFVQGLIREVAYNTLSRKDRKARHLAAARWFEALGEEELAGALAGHYLAARTNATDGAEADALAAQARIALKAAADRAAALGAHEQAVRFYEQALSVTTDPRELAELERRAGESAAKWAQYDSAELHFQRAIEGFRELGERSVAASIAGALGTMLIVGRRNDRGVAILEAAAAEYGDLEDDPGMLAILGASARASYLRSDHSAAIALADRVLPAAERRDHLDVLADTLVTKGTALALGGRAREGLAVVQAGGRIAAAAGLSSTELRARNNELSLTNDVDPAGAASACLSGLQLARRLGERNWVLSFTGNLGFVTMRTGDWEASIARLRAALADTTDALDRILLVNNLLNLLALRGDPLEAELDELTTTAGLASGDPQATLYVSESVGWIALAEGRFADAREAWARMTAADPGSSGSSFGWTARLALWLGDLDGAEADARSFYEYSPHGGAVDVTHAMLLAGLQARRGDRNGALMTYRTGLHAFQELGLPVDEAWLAHEMVDALGVDEPVVAEAVATARATWTRIGARPLLRLLEDAVARAGSADGGEAGRRDAAAERRSTAADIPA
jgi:class 3 adenylate cyclase/tetratricopeptide (TPR) repeat protein